MSAKPQTLYPEKTAQTVEQQLEQLAAAPKGHTLRTLIERLRPKIKAAHAAGYTYEELVCTLESSGITITANTLKQYLREPKPGEGLAADLTTALPQRHPRKIKPDGAQPVGSLAVPHLG